MSTSTLVLVRHGQSQWNLENRFTGWVDVSLSPKGVDEAKTAGKLLQDAKITPSLAHCSLLRRAGQTLHHILDEMGMLYIPVHKSWRLNERHYGALQGLNKSETAEKHGEQQVNIWRRSYDVRPPLVETTSEHHPSRDPRYQSLAPDLLPAGECLKDTVDRMLPYWHDAIVPQLREGKTPLIVAHGNSLRALVKHLDGLSDEAITKLNIPTGIPLVYELGEKLEAVKSAYLGNPEEIAQAAKAVANQGRK